MHSNTRYGKHLFGLMIAIAILITFAHLYTHSREVSPSRKSFIKFMSARANVANQTILQERAQLLVLYGEFQKHQVLTPLSKEWLIYLANTYKLPNPDFSKPSDWHALIKRVDIVPNELVIAQAINESDWGQSHFAQEGNNYFGIWCYVPGCGIKPAQEKPGPYYAVKHYSSALKSVEDYMNNLNSNSEYEQFRMERALLRAQTQTISGEALVNSLTRYSERGNAYVDTIRKIIQKYDLAQYNEIPENRVNLSLETVINELKITAKNQAKAN